MTPTRVGSSCQETGGDPPIFGKFCYLKTSKFLVNSAHSELFTDHWLRWSETR